MSNANQMTSQFLQFTRFEREAYQAGYRKVAGVDEAGRGPLAGPVVAAACFIPLHVLIEGVDDSKKLTPKKREKLFQELTTCSEIKFGVGVVSHEEIDRINILQATIQAMLRAVDELESKLEAGVEFKFESKLEAGVESRLESKLDSGLESRLKAKQGVDYLLVDGLKLPHERIETAKIIQGDALSYVIAAASIIAKETRDRIMDHYHEIYPQYGFDRHKGYGTEFHRKAIETYGPCPIHRMTFAPLSSMS